MSYKILITGAAGFIGSHICKSFLNDNHEIYGIDNLNDYYDVNLKKNRLKTFSNHTNFTFNEIDISNYTELANIFSKFKPDYVINLAAQAGVRYSLKNPFSYLNSNLVGFLNVIELCKDYSIKKLIYASSSSVYGENTKIPFSENDITDTPLSLYAATKKSNELIAYSYSKLFNICCIGLRFFTVYGPWGRPDMAYFSFTEKIIKNEAIDVYNNGDMKRDFTYIDDIVDGVRLTLERKDSYEIFNLGNNKPEKLMDLISYLENFLNKKAKINFLPMQPGEVYQTYADIDKSNEILGYSPKVNLEDGINQFIKWYKKEYSYDV